MTEASIEVAEIGSCPLTLPDRKVTACNIVNGTSIFKPGALAYISATNGQGERIEIIGRSRSGRWVQHYEPLDNVTNYRDKTFPPEHPLYNDPRVRTNFEPPTPEERAAVDAFLAAWLAAPPGAKP